LRRKTKQFDVRTDKYPFDTIKQNHLTFLLSNNVLTSNSLMFALWNNVLTLLIQTYWRSHYVPTFWR